MSWTYSGNPKDSKLDECRFILMDTNKDAPLLQDEEIEYIITQSAGDDNKLCYLLFNHAATIFARDIKRTLGPQSEDPTSRLNFYKQQADLYKSKLYSAGLSLPHFGHPKVFSIGMQNNPPWPKRKGGTLNV